MTKHRIIIDCDPGHDDMAAILLAAWHDDITIEAITDTYSNALMPLPRTASGERGPLQPLGQAALFGADDAQPGLRGRS